MLFTSQLTFGDTIPQNCYISGFCSLLRPGGFFKIVCTDLGPKSLKIVKASHLDIDSGKVTEIPGRVPCLLQVP